MAVYIGHDECQVIYVAKNGQQRRVSSIWVGDRQVFPPANRQELHVFTRDTQGYGREDHGAFFGFTVPVPWWATSMDVVIIGAGEKGRDGTKSFSGGTDGAGGKSGAWMVATHSMTTSSVASIVVGKGTTTTPYDTYVYIPGAGEDSILVTDSQGTRTPNNGSTGGSVTPRSRTEYGQVHNGGAGGSRNNAGGHPGGGGGGGQGSNLLGNPQAGRNGGDGYVWLRFRSAPLLDPGDDEFILRVGATSGVAYLPLHEWAVGIGKTPQTITEITVPMEVIGPSLQLLFSGCSSLTSAPAMNTSQVTDMYAMFADCSSLTSIPALDTSQVTNMYGLFYGCTSLTSIPALDASQVADVTDMFDGCTSLESVTLPGMGNGFTASQTLGMKATKLNAAAANALMASLGSPAPGGNLQLPATAAGADTSIATAKNWTVTIA